MLAHAIACVLALVSAVGAVPDFGLMFGRSSGPVVEIAGLSQLQALGPPQTHQARYYLTTFDRTST
jgi:hypothetical protein